MKKVRDVMARGVVTVRLDTPVKDVAKILIENGVSGVVVVDEKGEVWGVITDTDLIKCYTDGKAGAVAEDIMSPQTLTVDPEMKLREAAAFLCSKGIHRAFVMSAGHACTKNFPVGVISVTDIVREITH